MVPFLQMRLDKVDGYGLDNSAPNKFHFVFVGIRNEASINTTQCFLLPSDFGVCLGLFRSLFTVPLCVQLPRLYVYLLNEKNEITDEKMMLSASYYVYLAFGWKTPAPFHPFLYLVFKQNFSNMKSGLVGRHIEIELNVCKWGPIVIAYRNKDLAWYFGQTFSMLWPLAFSYNETMNENPTAKIAKRNDGKENNL